MTSARRELTSAAAVVLAALWPFAWRVWLLASAARVAVAVAR